MPVILPERALLSLRTRLELEVEGGEIISVTFFDATPPGWSLFASLIPGNKIWILVGLLDDAALFKIIVYKGKQKVRSAW